MLRELNILVPDLIARSITRISHSTNYDEKEKCFKRFSSFWKLTMSGDLASDPYITQINKLGLFMMIELLDDENPLLRHASKNWLIDSIGFFEKILDPLLEDMIKTTSLYISEGGQFFFTEAYDTGKVFSRFKKLKNILVTIPVEFADFLLRYHVSSRIRQYFHNLIENELLREGRDVTYFELLIVICIRYIQGQALDCLSPIFAKDNQKVSSVACEFFDLLVTNIPQKAIEIAKYVYKPLLIVQRHAVINNNFVMQVQLLSLLKFIIFGKNAMNSIDKRSELEAILESPMLMPKIIQGLQSRSPYVLIQYVNFINQAMPTLSEILQPEKLTKLIEQILETYRKLIDKYSNNPTGDDEDKVVIQRTETPVVRAMEAEILKLVNPTETTAPIPASPVPPVPQGTIAEGGQTIALPNQNLTVTEKTSVNQPSPANNSSKQSSAVIQPSIPIPDPAKNELQDSDLIGTDATAEHQKGTTLFESSGLQLQSNVMELISILIEGIYFIYNYFLNIEHVEEQHKAGKLHSEKESMFIRVLTLGIMGSNAKRSEPEDIIHLDIAKSIVLSFGKTLKVFISCWTAQEEFDRFFKIFNLGMPVFNFTEFQEYNSTDDIDESTHIKNVKKSILRIVRSLYLKFKEIVMDTFLEVWYAEVRYKMYPPEREKLYRAGKFVEYP